VRHTIHRGDFAQPGAARRCAHDNTRCR
jgi:hypothetical protein